MQPGAPLIDFSQIAQTALAKQTALASQTNRGAGQSQAAGTPDRIQAAVKEFEAVFISQMLAPMFEGLESDGLFGGGPGEDIYRSLLVEEYGKVIGRSGGIGLTDALQREFIRLQEAGQ